MIAILKSGPPPLEPASIVNVSIEQIKGIGLEASITLVQSALKSAKATREKFVLSAVLGQLYLRAKDADIEVAAQTSTNTSYRNRICVYKLVAAYPLLLNLDGLAYSDVCDWAKKINYQLENDAGVWGVNSAPYDEAEYLSIFWMLGLDE